MIKNLLGDDHEPSETPADTSARPLSQSQVISLFDSEQEEKVGDSEPFILSHSEPESIAETARKSGLAWSMGIVFVISVVFMMILGWGADLLFGSAPWGLVIGIVTGALIGFFQLFRLSTQILHK